MQFDLLLIRNINDIYSEVTTKRLKTCFWFTTNESIVTCISMEIKKNKKRGISLNKKQKTERQNTENKE